MQQPDVTGWIRGLHQGLAARRRRGRVGRWHVKLMGLKAAKGRGSVTVLRAPEAAARHMLVCAVTPPMLCRTAPHPLSRHRVLPLHHFDGHHARQPPGRSSQSVFCQQHLQHSTGESSEGRDKQRKGALLSQPDSGYSRQSVRQVGRQAPEQLKAGGTATYGPKLEAAGTPADKMTAAQRPYAAVTWAEAPSPSVLR